MSVTREHIEGARDLFSDLGEVSTRKMMGGLCLYHGGTIFANMVEDGRLYLKGQGDFIAELEAEGCTQWSYQREGRDRPTRMPYWTLPDDALDDPELACNWARRALAHL